MVLPDLRGRLCVECNAAADFGIEHNQWTGVTRRYYCEADRDYALDVMDGGRGVGVAGRTFLRSMVEVQ